MGVVGGGGAEVGEGVEVGVGVVAGAGDGAELEPLAFSKGGRVSQPFREIDAWIPLFALVWALEFNDVGAGVWDPRSSVGRALCDQAVKFWRARVR